MPVAEDLQAGTSIADINWPSNNRFNAGFDFSYRAISATCRSTTPTPPTGRTCSMCDMPARPKAYTLVNAGVGVRWAGDNIVTSLKVINIGNEEVQQHIFGDIVKRQIVGEARFTF